MSEAITPFELISKAHQNESLFAEKLIYGKSGKDSLNWPENDQIVEQVVYAKEIFFNDLIYHFIIEEEVIFNRIRNVAKDKAIIQLIDLLMEQHVKMKGLFSNLDVSDKTDDQLRASLKEIGELLKNHIDTEENQIYPLLKSELDPSILGEMTVELQKRKKPEV